MVGIGGEAEEPGEEEEEEEDNGQWVAPDAGATRPGRGGRKKDGAPEGIELGGEKRD